MKKNRSKTIDLGGTRIYKKDAYQLYQELCDRVFGKDAVKITAAPANNVLKNLFQDSSFKIQVSRFKFQGFKIKNLRIREFLLRD